MDRLSPDDDATRGGGGIGTGSLVIALLAGVTMIFSLLTLIDSLTTGNIPPGIVGAGGVFVSFVAMFWVFNKMRTTM